MTNIAPSGLDVRERVIWVIDEAVTATQRYKYLEGRSGISARKWQNVYHRAQQPSIEMIAELARMRPEFLSWMVSGQALGSWQINPEHAGWRDDLHERIFGSPPPKLPPGDPLSEEQMAELMSKLFPPSKPALGKKEKPSRAASKRVRRRKSQGE